MDVSLLQDTTGSSATRCRGEIRLLFLCVVGQRPHSAPLPRRRAGWALPLGAGTPRSALGGLGGALRQPQTRGPKSYPSGRSVVAVQHYCVSASVSGVIPGDRPCGPASISTHAPMGAVREPVRRGQRERGVPVSGPSSAALESTGPRLLLSVSGALARGSGG